MNALRGVLYEHGFSFPQGTRHLGRIQAVLADPENGLDPLTLDECQDLFDQITEATTRIDAKTRKISDLAAKTDIARRLQTMPGVGPMTAMAIEAFAPAMETFKSGRDFAAWLGLVPVQKSTGGRQILGRTSKMGQRDVRRLLIIGAMTRVRWAVKNGPPKGSWLEQMLGRKPRMLVAIALATKPPARSGR